MTRHQPLALALLERKLIVVTGKGGVGKSTIAAAIGLSAAARGLRTIVVELGDQRRLPGLFATAQASGAAPVDGVAQSAAPSPRPGDRPGEEIALAENLWSVTIDQDRAMLEWLQALGGRVPGRVLAGSGTFQYFAAAAPGARELISMVKLWELTQADRWRRRTQRYDLVVLDAPATGHALGLLRSPHTFGAIARVGPIFGQAERVRELLEDGTQTAYVAVTRPTEMAVGETIDLRSGLRKALGARLDLVIANAIVPSRRFSATEIESIASARADGERAWVTGTKRRRARTASAATSKKPPSSGTQAAGAAADRLLEPRHSALLAARGAHARARAEQGQLARLRRQGVPVQTVPFVFVPRLDLQAVRQIARRLTSSP
jgi:Mrp family chromosome partitioning ATPase